MSAHDVLQQLVIGLLMQGVGFLFMKWYFFWRKREEAPKDLQEDIDELRDDIVNLRESVARINGRLNGHEWKRG